jgi:hypothetical protein
MSGEADLEARGLLIRSLGTLRGMLPGSFVERRRSCGRPNCHCPGGQNRHSQLQVSVLVEGKPRTCNLSAKLVSKVRQQVEMRHRLDAAAATICGLHRRRFLKDQENQ